MSLETGLVQIYYGKGKGKTTAAFGLAVRAAGQGFRVYIAQFLKPNHSGELKSVSLLENITLEKINHDSFLGEISQELRTKTIDIYSKKLPQIEKYLSEKKYDLVILDEILNAFALGLVSEENLKGLLAARNPQVELVLTGRSAPAWLIEEANLVTEVKLIKHPYQRKIPARRGIEF